MIGLVIATRFHYFLVVIRSRIQTGHASQSAHFQVYDFIPQILHSHPLLGLGLNNFSLYYQAATGKTNWGPHSFYVSLIVETGLVGTVLFALFLFWVFVRLKAARELGNALARAGDPLARRVRPLAWGWTAALAGTLAANVFYLTMSFYYFFVFLALALATPLVFRPEGRAGARSRRRLPPACARADGVVPGAGLCPDDVVSPYAGRGGRQLRRRRRRPAEARGGRGRRRLACRLPPLRDRLRGRNRPEPQGARRGAFCCVPLFLGSFALAARPSLEAADVVHAHWIPSALPALATRKPFVLQVWGTDVELARRAPRLVRPLLRRARLVVAASLVPRRRGEAPRRAGRAGDPERGRDPRGGRRPRRAAARALRRAAQRGEGDPRVPARRPRGCRG